VVFGHEGSEGFGLERGEEALGDRVVPAVALPAHARDRTRPLERASIVGARVGAAAVGVVHEARRWPTCSERCVQGVECKRGVVAGARRPAHHAARVEVEDGGQEEPTRGGMAEVFAGRLVGDAGFNRVVAIKAIRPDLIEDPAYVTMFLDEARLAANVQSQYVVHTFDLGRTEDGVPFMVMELVIGATVSQLIKACQPSPMPLPFALTFLAQSLRGLDDAHAALSPTGEPLRIVHRDLAPKNILVGVDGRARIVDFGIAHAVERLTRTTTGQIEGTVRYFSPEQADLQPLDQRSDIFSMGIVAFEMLTGKRLFTGRNMIEIYGQVMNHPIPDIREFVPDIPDGLARVVAKAAPEPKRVSTTGWALIALVLMVAALLVALLSLASMSPLE
jgi:hypothetical protein